MDKTHDILIIFNMRTNNEYICNTFIVAISSKVQSLILSNDTRFN